MKKRAPALPNSPTLPQLWDAFCSKLAESGREDLLYTQGVRGSSPLLPTKGHFCSRRGLMKLKRKLYKCQFKLISGNKLLLSFYYPSIKVTCIPLYDAQCAQQ